MKSRICISIFILGAVLHTSIFAEVIITTADGRGADNQVMGYGNDREAINIEGASHFEVRGHSYSGNNYYGVSRFDLAMADLPETVYEAALTLSIVNMKRG